VPLLFEAAEGELATPTFPLFMVAFGGTEVDGRCLDRREGGGEAL